MVKKAHDREAHGDYEGAYNDLAEGLRASPKNKDLLEQKTRISELYAQDLLRRAACLPTNNLVTRIELLQSAAQLECGNHDEIAIALGNLMDERTAIHKRADVVVTSTNLVEMVTVVETMSDYINFDPRLRKKLIDNPDVIAHVENLFTQLTGNDLRDTRKLALRCGEIWRSEGIRQIRERTDARLRYLGVKALAPPAFADTSLGSEAVSFLVAALLAPSSNESIEAYRAQ